MPKQLKKMTEEKCSKCGLRSKSPASAMTNRKALAAPVQAPGNEESPEMAGSKDLLEGVLARQGDGLLHRQSVVLGRRPAAVQG